MPKITEAEWETHYEPYQDLFDCDYPPVVTADERYVWTQCDGETDYVIYAGRRRVNRIACYLAKNPWDDRETWIDLGSGL